MSPARPNAIIRLGNRIVVFLMRLGVPMGSMTMLTVKGRRSGMARTTPVTLSSHGNGWVVGSPFGAGDWVRNLRAAGEGELLMRGRVVRVGAAELSPSIAAPLLMESIGRMGFVPRRVLAGYFDIPLDSPLALWETEVGRHPMFMLTPLDGEHRNSA